MKFLKRIDAASTPAFSLGRVSLTSGSLGKFPSRNPRWPPFFGLRLGPRGRLAKQVQQAEPV